MRSVFEILLGLLVLYGSTMYFARAFERISDTTAPTPFFSTITFEGLKFSACSMICFMQ